MSPEALLEQFDALADAPNGVQKLRQLILQLAVRGKLGSQQNDDETASELLLRIEAEKTRLAELGVISASKSAVPVGQSETPYPIPENWAWTRLRQIGETSPRNELDDERTAAFCPMNMLPERYSGEVQFEQRAWKEIKKGYTHFADNDVVLAKITPCFQNGKGAVMRNLVGGKGAGSTELYVFRPLGDTLVSEYILAFLKSPGFVDGGIPRMTGTAGQQRVPREYFESTPFPLPPIAEQRRIVAKIDQLMRLCDELEERQRRRAEARDRLNRAALHSLASAVDNAAVGECWERISKQFDLLYESPEAVAELRKAIIGLACAGRLTKPARDTRANVADAETILKEIKLRQLDEYRSTCSSADQVVRLRRKLVTQSLTTPEPSLIPPSWRWASLLQICETIVDCHNKTAPYATRGIPLIRTSNIRGGALVLEQLRYVTDETYTYWSRRCPPEPGDILFTREAPMGEAAIVPAGMKVCLGQRTMLLRVYPDLIERQYVLLALQDPAFQTRMRASAIGMTVKHLRVGDVESLLIPLPPLDEQREIVRVTHQLLAFCDALEAKLTDARTRSEHLASAVVHHLTTA